MEEIKFVKMNPNKNTTILVINSYPRQLYSSISKALMSEESVCAEQVGFIEKAEDPLAHSRLHMMGGEFCANAVVALCGYLSYRNKTDLAIVDAYNIEVSGSENLVVCETQKFEKGYRSKITMPFPEHIEEEVLTYKGQSIKTICVFYTDIFQRIVYENQDLGDLEELAHYLLHIKGGERYATKGITFYNKQRNQIRPLIYVKETDTSVWESSCGIASASIVAYMAYKKGETASIKIIQPSGDFIKAQATYRNGEMTRITIEEDAYLSVVGSAYINLEEGD